MIRYDRFFLVVTCLLIASVRLASATVVNATWNSGTDVPVTSASYTATGNTVNFVLNFAPATGTNLTVISNTGLPFISGTFDNLAQGQAVALIYHGVTYKYVAHYYGGTGNDLVLVWATNRVLAWGNNTSGQVGDGSYANQRNVMVPVDATGVLAGKTILSQSQGGSHTLALCSDGTVVAWGSNYYGQLGIGSTTDSHVPVAVNSASGVSALYGKRVVAVSAGGAHSLALCSDGTVVSWGSNSSGTLGDNSSISRNVPVAVNTASGVSALYGKTVVAIAAGGQDHSLALCSDGTVVAWGGNVFGELGTNNQTSSAVPVLVNTASGVSALYGKTVVAISAGNMHSLVQCSDGTLAAWGYAYMGQLGDNKQVPSAYVPVRVSTTNGVSALYGKTVASIAAGGDVSMALCTDGTLTAWGDNQGGALAASTPQKAYAPMQISTTDTNSALYGRTIMGIVAGQSRAFCSDGTFAAWGNNAYGQLGINSTDFSLLPVPVLTTPLSFGERLVMPSGGLSNTYSTALVASPSLSATTMAATALTTSSATLNGSVVSPSGTVTVSFDWGTTTAYGNSLAATPGTVSTNTPTAVSAVLSGLMLNTTYHYRVNTGAAVGQDMTFVLRNNDASLSSLVLSGGTLSPGFSTGTKTYAVNVPYLTNSIKLTAMVTDSAASIQLNGSPIASGAATPGIPLLEGSNTLSLLVTAADGATTLTYTITATRAQGPSLSALVPGSGTLSPAFAANTLQYTMSVPASTGTLSLTPTLSDASTTVKVGGATVPSGSASSPVSLFYGDNSIPVSVTSNDGSMTKTYLVLVTRGIPTTIAAGFDSASSVPVTTSSLNASGRTLNFTLNYAPLPGTTLTAVNNTGLGFINGTFDNLAQGQAVLLSYNGVTYKFVASYYGGTGNDLVLTWAGTRLIGWGNNRDGQLGNQSRSLLAGTTLAGLMPVSAGIGNGISAALFADGTVATWGDNYVGELGNGSTDTGSTVPAAIPTAGTALAGKFVVAISVGGSHILALCSDGTVASWGDNTYGQLGNPVTGYSRVPVAVTTAGTPLAGRTVVAIAAGGLHSVALCSDGTLVEWGTDNEAEVSYSTVTPHSTPTLVDTTGTPLAGRTVLSVAAGGYHNIALCSDGTLVGWGGNGLGQLGDGTATGSLLPVPPTTVITIGTVLEGKTVVAVSAGATHTLALCSDGTLAAWGGNAYGDLGNNSTTSSSLPVAVSTSGMLAGKTVIGITAGQETSTAWCSDATVAAWGRNDFSQLGSSTAGSATSIPVMVDAQALAAGEKIRQVSSSAFTLGALALVATTPPDGLPPSSDATLSGLALGTGTLNVPFASSTYGYFVILDSTVTTLTLTPVVHESHASITVNGQAVASGSVSPPLPLVAGLSGNPVSVVVTAQDGTTQTYSLFVMCLGKVEQWRFNAFGIPFNSGTAADNADFDGDGICNLLEYALNLNPTAASRLPVTSVMNGGNFEYTYARSTAAVNAGTTFAVEASASLSAPSWSGSGIIQTIVSDDGTTQQVKAVIPVNAANAMFVHLSVTPPP